MKINLRVMFHFIPVCMYHHVNEHAHDRLTVSIDNFEKQMAMLAREGYRTLSSAELLEFKHGRLKTPKKTVVLTFDDAWLDNYVHAFPIMRRYGHKFIIFVVSDRTDAASRSLRDSRPVQFPLHDKAEQLAVSTETAWQVVCAWDDLGEMVRSGLCSVESHAASHRHCTMPGARRGMREDLERGMKAIEAAIGTPGN